MNNVYCKSCVHIQHDEHFREEAWLEFLVTCTVGEVVSMLFRSNFVIGSRSPASKIEHPQCGKCGV